ncbi:alpha/beta hydrolase [Pseudoalteromonas luteoviolacea]|uniref:dienelactone hydrolase family protein n=1 Tax=Pseudoalteromonas luteoviolacea TaxID=43657 RepID=UPI001B38814E|nr:alpha/beta hydrolase [Pseudoalteromonas luteoviolacea]MBQ4810867.1 alpha/beta hydrolase [Pseudoalteromonas luteoviolacea]
MNIIHSLAITSILTSTSALANINLTAKDGFTLKGQYFSAPSSSDSAVLMLHQCNYNQTMYKNIGKQLASNRIHALSIDFRGFGESATTQYDVRTLSQLSTEQRRKAWQDMSAHWPSDVQIAYQFLKDKVGAQGKIGVIGASCGGSQAIELALNNQIAAIGFFSSAQNDKNIEKYTNSLSGKPTLIIAAEEDGRTYTSAQALFVEAKHSNSKFLAYKGKDHGYPLLDKDSNLTPAIVTWFSHQIN